MRVSDDDDRKWKVLKSEYLFKRPWLTARRDEVELPNGARHGLGKTCYELCAGVCEERDGDPMESAKRELLEETGYGRGEWQLWMTVSANASAMNNLTYCYLATDVEPVDTQHLEATEDLTVHLLTVDEVRQLLMDDEVKQSLMAAPLWKYFYLYDKR